jgi:hypothetical protein
VAFVRLDREGNFDNHRSLTSKSPSSKVYPTYSSRTLGGFTGNVSSVGFGVGSCVQDKASAGYHSILPEGIETGSVSMSTLLVTLEDNARVEFVRYVITSICTVVLSGHFRSLGR